MILPLVSALVLQSADIPLTSGLGISGVTQSGRVPAPIDLVQQRIVSGRWSPPAAGEKMQGVREGEVAWAEMRANQEGVFEGGATRGGYVYIVHESAEEKPMVLQAAGDTMVYINGEPRAGDPYSYGYLHLPFMMKKGKNEFLFACGRGRLQAKLISPKGPVTFNAGDVTLPDILVDRDEDLVGAIPVLNSSERRRSALTVEVYSGNEKIGSGAVPRLEAFSLRKIPFTFRPKKQTVGREIELTLVIFEKGKPVRDEAKVKVRVRKPTEHYKRTFISGIDGSVQYYAVAPSLKPSKENALVLTVHGASVEALNQAQAYKPKDWCTIVAATNRRPYGFDWEDWGRMDAMEVLDLAKKEFPHNPQRVVLTGHSMGGHGTWQIGLTYPGHFAAIGPSAGWVSFWSYAGGWQPRDPNAVEQTLFRSTTSSDTLKMLRNSLMQDVYILHGDKDDNVPVEQARTMKAELEKIGATFTYHEQPGAGHWWGDECVDWPPMFDVFANAKLAPRESWEFTTMNPTVSAYCRGITIEQQIEAMKPSRVIASKGRDGTWTLITENVAKLSIDSTQVAVTPKIVLDGQSIELASSDTPEARKVLSSYVKLRTGWIVNVVAPPDRQKSPKQGGPFKLAFQNRMAFVIGTRGTASENQWALNKARFDAESWYYRGNGAVDIILDSEIGRFRDRNLILYGNQETNSAFRLLGKCPIKLTRKGIRVGSDRFDGENLSAVYLYPEGSRTIGVVGGTGAEGLRYTDRMPYFTSGVAYPDWAVFPSQTLTEGSKRALSAGFFSNEWGL